MGMDWVARPWGVEDPYGAYRAEPAESSEDEAEDDEVSLRAQLFACPAAYQ